MGFAKSVIGDYYIRDFGTCQMNVDVENERLIYPEDEGLVVNDKTTSNFSHNENFVVFECVCRLLEKGYRPEHIELEPRWQLGRDGKSGKADIVVKDEDGRVLIIIECKTAGAEYNNEIKNTEEYGGQLFSYWQQENATRWLALYASDWKDGEVIVTSQVIRCTDDANILRMAEKDKEVLTYRNAKNDTERYEVWKETYGRAWLDNVIFAEESQAYKIGIPPLRKGKLRDFTPGDKIVNRFEEILRHNNVSDKENAFNRLVALFICKLVDEIKKQDFEEVDFQYKQGTDDYETLQDRLQRLHQQGMEEFMREKIFYVEADYAERLFQQYTGSKRKAAIEDLKNTIRILKFYSNNDFAFKDVHNEELFFQNGKILVEVVQLFQPYRIVYPSKHQFLGDLFEQLLNKGFKQNEGQFFTPMPITRFIWDALPLPSYISEHGLPNVIDYACGAGHFLTEAVEAINEVRKDGNNSWVEKHIYGIEKDYRLARVSKISMFMNGAGGANIIFGDGLENYEDKHVTPSSFDILVANPPYSVKGFKQHLKLRNNSFRLLDLLTNDAKEIETLFVERIAQLLRPQGIAAVVLPASILTNGGCYTTAREELLQNFMFRAIVSFGSKTFGATGTNTVTLFLERYNEPPRIAAITQDSVSAIMSGAELTDWSDRQLFDAYIARQGVKADTYRKFLARDLKLQEVEKDDYLKTYTDAFSSMTIAYPKRATEEEKAALRRTKFYEFALGVEWEKLYYFALALPQTTVVITAPSDNKDQKAFLGYDWSNQKGKEGIIINNPGGKLYDDTNRFARGTLACAVRNAFVGAITKLPDDVAKYTATCRLTDMMDFSRATFDKAVSTTARAEAVKISSKYEIVKFEDVCVDINPHRSELRSLDANTVVSFVDMASLDTMGFIKAQEQRKLSDVIRGGYTYFRENDIIIAKITPCMENGKCAIAKGLSNGIGFGSSEYHVFRTNNKVITEYAFIYLNREEIRLEAAKSMTGASGHRRVPVEFYEDLPIPLPPLSIQKQIVAECEKVDEEYNTSRMTVETYRQKIADLFERLEIVNKSKWGGVKPLNTICTYATERCPFTEISLAEYISTDNLLQNCEGVTAYDGEPNIDSVIRFRKGDILLSNIRPYLKKLWLADRDGGCNPDVLVIRTTISDFLPEYVAGVLKQQPFFDHVMQNVKGMKMPRGNKDHIMRYAIPSVPVDEQRGLMKTVAGYETVISEAKSTMGACVARKQAILTKFLQ